MANINIVLYEPLIPQNTGNIMRTCVGTGAMLHLIKPLGFKLDETKLKRSAVDYYDHIEYRLYDNWDDFISKNITDNLFFLTRYGNKPISSIDFKKTIQNNNNDHNIYLIFGNESTGTPKHILEKHLNNCFRIPMNDKIRSLNLSNSVSIALYEVLRQLEYLNLSYTEPEKYKGSDYLGNTKKEK